MARKPTEEGSQLGGFHGVSFISLVNADSSSCRHRPFSDIIWSAIADVNTSKIRDCSCRENSYKIFFHIIFDCRVVAIPI